MAGVTQATDATYSEPRRAQEAEGAVRAPRASRSFLGAVRNQQIYSKIQRSKRQGRRNGRSNKLAQKKYGHQAKIMRTRVSQNADTIPVRRETNAGSAQGTRAAPRGRKAAKTESGGRTSGNEGGGGVCPNPLGQLPCASSHVEVPLSFLNKLPLRRSPAPSPYSWQRCAASAPPGVRARPSVPSSL